MICTWNLNPPTQLVLLEWCIKVPGLKNQVKHETRSFELTLMFSAEQAYLYHPLRGVLNPELDDAFEMSNEDKVKKSTKEMTVSFMVDASPTTWLKRRII